MPPGNYKTLVKTLPCVANDKKRKRTKEYEKNKINLLTWHSSMQSTVAFLRFGYVKIMDYHFLTPKFFLKYNNKNDFLKKEKQTPHRVHAL
jgi:hypothetical protein